MLANSLQDGNQHGGSSTALSQHAAQSMAAVCAGGLSPLQRTSPSAAILESECRLSHPASESADDVIPPSHSARVGAQKVSRHRHHSLFLPEPNRPTFCACLPVSLLLVYGAIFLKPQRDISNFPSLVKQLWIFFHQRLIRVPA